MTPQQQLDSLGRVVPQNVSDLNIGQSVLKRISHLEDMLRKLTAEISGAIEEHGEELRKIIGPGNFAVLKLFVADAECCLSQKGGK